MPVETSNAITISTLSDWFKNHASVFQPMRSDTKSNRTLYAPFSSSFEQVEGIARNSDWFMALFLPVIVIGRSNYFGISFSTRICKQLYLRCLFHCGSKKPQR